MLYRADVPPKVAINEALELSTRFGDAKAKSFINGILDAAIKLRKPVRSQLRARPTPDRLVGFDAKAGRSRSGPRLYSNKDQS